MQNVLQGYGPPPKDGPGVGEDRDAVTADAGDPARHPIEVALEYIQMCNSCTAPRTFSVSGFDCHPMIEVVQPELHPAQEAALRQACRMVGRYFDLHIQDLETEIKQEKLIANQAWKALKAQGVSNGKGKEGGNRDHSGGSS